MKVGPLSHHICGEDRVVDRQSHRRSILACVKVVYFVGMVVVVILVVVVVFNVVVGVGKCSRREEFRIKFFDESYIFLVKHLPFDVTERGNAGWR